MLRLRLSKFILKRAVVITLHTVIVRVSGFRNPTLTVKFVLGGFGFFKNNDIDTL